MLGIYAQIVATNGSGVATDRMRLDKGRSSATRRPCFELNIAASACLCWMIACKVLGSRHGLRMAEPAHVQPHLVGAKAGQGHVWKVVPQAEALQQSKHTTRQSKLYPQVV